jgi:ABC-type multidrug transport system fused ATPase/permease subunit
MAQTAAASHYQQRVDAWPDSLFAFAWRESRRHQPWLSLLAAVIFPPTMVPLELQRRIIDRAIGDPNLELLFWLGAIYLGTVVVHGGLKYLLRIYRAFVSECATLHLRRAVRDRGGQDDQGKTVSIVASEVERVGGFVGEAFSEPILQGGILVAVLGYMLVVEPTIALVSLSFFLPQMLLVPLIERVVNRRAARKIRLVRELGEQIVNAVRREHYEHTARRV